MEANNNSSSPILQFYHNKTVFITGATGFMGKVSTVGYSGATDRRVVVTISGPGGEAVTKHACSEGLAVDQTQERC